MITKDICDFGAWLISTILGWMPTFTLPSWVSSIAGELTSALSLANKFGYWVPVQALATVAGFILTCFTVAFTIRVVRIVASFFTAGGGSAA